MAQGRTPRSERSERTSAGRAKPHISNHFAKQNTGHLWINLRETVCEAKLKTSAGSAFMQSAYTAGFFARKLGIQNLCLHKLCIPSLRAKNPP